MPLLLLTSGGLFVNLPVKKFQEGRLFIQTEINQYQPGLYWMHEVGEWKPYHVNQKAIDSNMGEDSLAIDMSRSDIFLAYFRAVHFLTCQNNQPGLGVLMYFTWNFCRVPQCQSNS